MEIYTTILQSGELSSRGQSLSVLSSSLSVNSGIWDKCTQLVPGIGLKCGKILCAAARHPRPHTWPRHPTGPMVRAVAAYLKVVRWKKPSSAKGMREESTRGGALSPGGWGSPMRFFFNFEHYCVRVLVNSNLSQLVP